MLGLILAAAITSGACANPSIVAADVQSVTTNDTLRHYVIAITVQNKGNVRQPSNLLQSVDVFQNGERVDRIGLQPLRPNQSQRVTYGFDRSTDAGDNSTHFEFTLDLNGRSGHNVDCHEGNENYKMRV